MICACDCQVQLHINNDDSKIFNKHRRRFTKEEIKTEVYRLFKAK